MRRFILGLVVVVFVLVAGPVGAVELQPGDLIVSAMPAGSYSDFSLVRLSGDTGHAEIISGCEDAACDSVVGLGPMWVSIEHIEASEDGELWVSTNGGVPGVEGCVDPACQSLFRVDPISGDRTLIAASSRSGEWPAPLTILVGSGFGFKGEGLEVVPTQTDPDPIPAGIPLPEWFGLLVVGFLFGVFYMKGKYDGRVVA